MPIEDQDRIFLCHASEDKKQVLEIYHKLMSAGFNPWLDKMDLLPGQKWDGEIRRALKHSRFIIIFFSKFSVSKRGYVQREFKLALDALEEIPEDQIFVIPVRLEDCRIPEAFRHIHYVDLFEQGGFELVVKVIEAELGPRNQFTDPRDGQTYKTVELMGKTWMAENLNFDVGEGCWFYDDDPKNGEKYGRLYTWEAAMKACPPGWRLPTDGEWKEMLTSVGGYFDSAERKNIGDPKKAYEFLIGNGNSGFNALPGGGRGSDGEYLYLGRGGSYWSATGSGADDAWIYFFDGVSRQVYRGYNSRSVGFSCRCLKD